MKLTPARARELRDKGVVVDVAAVIKSSRNEQPKPVEVKQPVVQSSTPAEILSLIEAQQDVNKALAGYGQALASLVSDMAKPKAKKKYECVVGRDARGNISTVGIEEK